MALNAEKRKLDKLISLARPAGSLTARLASLTENEKARYDEWRTDCSRWFAGFREPGRAYEIYLDGSFRPPELDHDLSRKLFDRAPLIMKGDSLDDCRRRHEDFSQ